MRVLVAMLLFVVGVLLVLVGINGKSDQFLSLIFGPNFTGLTGGLSSGANAGGSGGIDIPGVGSANAGGPPLTGGMVPGKPGAP